MSNERISWIDDEKGFILLGVCLGHICDSWQLLPYLSIYHMAAFFFLSGMLYKRERYSSFGMLMKAKWSTLLKPYLLLSLFFLLITPRLYDASYHTVPHPWIAQIGEVLGWSSYCCGVVNQAVMYLWDIANGHSCSCVLPLWFVASLFLINILFYCYTRIEQHVSDKRWMLGSFGMVCLLIGWLLSYYRVALPINLSTAITGLGFYSLGNLLSEFIPRFCQLSKTKSILIVSLMWIVCYAGVFGLGIDHIHYFANELPDNLLAYLGAAVFGSIAITLTFALLGNFLHRTIVDKGLRIIAQNGIFILALHYYILTSCKWVGAHWQPTFSNPYFILLLVIICCVLFTPTCNRYFYWLIGKGRPHANKSNLQSLSKQRTIWIDSLKGYVLLGVVIFHVNNGVSILPGFDKCHMSTFFLLSGLLFNNNSNLSIGQYVKKKSFTLLLPYWALSLLFGICSWKYYYPEFYPNAPEFLATFLTQHQVDMPERGIILLVATELLNIINGSSVSITIPLWFVFVLWQISCFYYIINACIGEKARRIILPACCTLLAILGGWLLSYHHVELPFKLATATTSLGFFSLGVLLQSTLRAIHKEWSTIRIVLLLLVVAIPFAIGGSHYYGHDIGYVNNVLGDNLAWYLMASICGSFTMCLLFMLIERCSYLRILQKLFCFAAQNGLVFLGLHAYLLALFLFITKNAHWLPWNIPVAIIIILVVCSYATIPVNKYIPWIVGKRNRL